VDYKNQSGQEYESAIHETRNSQKPHAFTPGSAGGVRFKVGRGAMRADFGGK
jgi:hypothetical protein